MVNARKACIGNLEHALAELAIYGKRPKKLLMLQAVGNTVGATKGKSEVDSIDQYTEELNTLNEQINEQTNMVERKQRPRLNALQRTGRLTKVSSLGLNSSLGDIGDDYEAGVPGKLGSAENPLVPKELVSPSILEASIRTLSSATALLVKEAVSKAPDVATVLAFSTVSTVKGAGTMLKKKAIKNTKKRAKQAQDSMNAAGDAVNSMIVKEEDGTADNAGFVTFTSLVATHGALQMNQYPELFALETETAPDEPRYIFWGNVGKNREVLHTGWLLSITATVAICLFWTFLVSFIVNLTNVEHLKSESASLEKTLDVNPWIGRVLSIISPLLLLIFTSGLLPIVLKTVSRLEFPASDSLLEASAFWKMAAFTVIQTFL